MTERELERRARRKLADADRGKRLASSRGGSSVFTVCATPMDAPSRAEASRNLDKSEGKAERLNRKAKVHR